MLREAIRADSEDATYDVFLCHSIGDEELIQGAKTILEKQQLIIYVDWIVDPQMDRSAVTAETAKKLRSRMNHCRIHVATAVSLKIPILETFDGDLIAQTGKVGNPPLTIRKPSEPVQKDFGL